MMTTVPPPISAWEVFLRMLCAMAVGTIIGTEREYSGRPAGMRTHILVALGSCAVMLTGQMIFAQYSPYGASPDPARMAAQVITGVGFLGAGTIIREGTTVRGLTTAASLWAVACLGVAAGGGYYAITLIGMVFILITLTVFEFLQNRLMGQSSGMVYYCLETRDIVAALQVLNVHARRQNAGIRDMRTLHGEDGTCQLLFQVDIGGFRFEQRRQHFLDGLAAEPVISSIHLTSQQEKRANEREHI